MVWYTRIITVASMVTSMQSTEGSSLGFDLFFLALPLAISVGLWVMTRVPRWCHLAAFSLGFALYALLAAYLTIFVFHRVDIKFWEVPETAFEIGLVSGALATAAAAIALAVGLLVGERIFKADPGRRHWVHSLVAGALISPVAGLFVLFFGDRYPHLGWELSSGVLVVLPILYGLLWFRRPATHPEPESPRTGEPGIDGR